MLFRGASSMLRRQDPSAIEQKVDLTNLARKLTYPNKGQACWFASGVRLFTPLRGCAVVTASVELSLETETL